MQAMSDLLWKYSAMAVLGANNLRPCIEHSTPNIVKRYLHVWNGVELNQRGLCNSASGEN